MGVLLDEAAASRLVLSGAEVVHKPRGLHRRVGTTRVSAVVAVESEAPGAVGRAERGNVVCAGIRATTVRTVLTFEYPSLLCLSFPFSDFNFFFLA